MFYFVSVKELSVLVSSNAGLVNDGTRKIFSKSKVILGIQHVATVSSEGLQTLLGKKTETNICKTYDMS